MKSHTERYQPLANGWDTRETMKAIWNRPPKAKVHQRTQSSLLKMFFHFFESWLLSTESNKKWTSLLNWWLRLYHLVVTFLMIHPPLNRNKYYWLLLYNWHRRQRMTICIVLKNYTQFQVFQQKVYVAKPNDVICIFLF
jgi:hypothetical protein